MKVDLHSHSSASDGILSPRNLVRRAASRGVRVLALTDHDTTAGLDEARDAARGAGMRLVDGVEISVAWGRFDLHVLGLNVDPGNADLQAGLSQLRAGRLLRARAIACSLAAAGIEGALEGASRFARSAGMLSRVHFARFLAASGCVRSAKSAFGPYLVKGKPGYVDHQWVELATALRWIRGAGGRAILAHPGRYGLLPPALAELIRFFRDSGGAGIEVDAGNRSSEQHRQLAGLAARYGLGCSQGSDFHAPGEGRDLGELPGLEANPWRQIRHVLDGPPA